MNSKKIDIKEIKEIEEKLITVGRKLVSKAVMFKDDIANIKNLEKALTNIEIIIKREAVKDGK